MKFMFHIKKQNENEGNHMSMGEAQIAAGEIWEVRWWKT
jgi:hypothetical protein